MWRVNYINQRFKEQNELSIEINAGAINNDTRTKRNQADASDIQIERYKM